MISSPSPCKHTLLQETHLHSSLHFKPAFLQEQRCEAHPVLQQQLTSSSMQSGAASDAIQSISRCWLLFKLVFHPLSWGDGADICAYRNREGNENLVSNTNKNEINNYKRHRTRHTKPCFNGNWNEIEPDMSHDQHTFTPVPIETGFS